MDSDCGKLTGCPCSGASKQCILSKTKYCCWHEDVRTDKNRLYLDGYGDIDLAYYGYTVPIDIYYCPACKVSATTVGDIIAELSEVLESPEDYHKRLTRERAARERDRIARRMFRVKH